MFSIKHLSMPPPLEKMTYTPMDISGRDPSDYLYAGRHLA